MAKKRNLLLVALIATFVLQCSNNPIATDREVSRELTASEKLLVESDNKFGLKLFYSSLAKLGDYEIDRILPGHGPEIVRVKKTFKGYRRHYDRISGATLRQLKKEPLTPYDVYLRLYRNTPGFVIYIGMSLVTGILQILQEDGAVESFEEDGKLFYRIT